MKNALLTSALALAILICTAGNAYACTGTYVGKKVSENGSTIIARTEDIGSAHPKSVVVYPEKNYPDGSMYESAITKFKCPNPSYTYKYYAVPDSDGNDDDETYDEVGFNEKGVAVSATVSADVNDAISAIDPLVEDGLREADIGTLVLSRAKTAKEGVKLLADLVEKYGSAEGNIIMIADHDEAWYMEILSGHQYAAIKLPDDAVAVIPNCFMLDYVNLNDKNNVIASKDVVNMPQKHGLLKYKDGKFSLRKTYGTERGNYDQDRLWGGYHFLAPSKKLPYSTDFSLFFQPDKKVSVKDVMELQKYRYEGTAIDANLPKNNTEKHKVRPIGIERQAECHVIELKDNFPKEAPGVLWLALGNAEHNVYLPYLPVIDKVNPEYSQRSHLFDENQAYWVFRGQGALAELNRDKYGKNVRDYWEKYQDKLIKDQDNVNKEFIEKYKANKNEAKDYANEQLSKVQKDSLEKADKMYKQLFTYVSGEAGRPHKDAFKPENMN